VVMTPDRKMLSANDSTTSHQTKAIGNATMNEFVRVTGSIVLCPMRVAESLQDLVGH